MRCLEIKKLNQIALSSLVLKFLLKYSNSRLSERSFFIHNSLS